MLPMVRTICVLPLHQTISSSAPSPWQSPLVTAPAPSCRNPSPWHGSFRQPSAPHQLVIAGLPDHLHVPTLYELLQVLGEFCSKIHQLLVWLTTVTPFEFELLESVSLAFNIVPSLADSLPSSLKISLHSSSLSPYLTSNSLLSSCMNVYEC